jgi:hypothetical protein
LEYYCIQMYNLKNMRFFYHNKELGGYCPVGENSSILAGAERYGIHPKKSVKARAFTDVEHYGQIATYQFIVPGQKPVWVSADGAVRDSEGRPEMAWVSQEVSKLIEDPNVTVILEMALKLLHPQK